MRNSIFKISANGNTLYGFKNEDTYYGCSWFRGH